MIRKQRDLILAAEIKVTRVPSSEYETIHSETAGKKIFIDFHSYRFVALQ